MPFPQASNSEMQAGVDGHTGPVPRSLWLLPLSLAFSSSPPHLAVPCYLALLSPGPDCLRNFRKGEEKSRVRGPERGPQNLAAS